MVHRSIRRRKRKGRSSGFVIHFRGAAVDQDKMDMIILDYARRTGDLLRQNGTRTEFNARMGIDAIAAGLYRPDRSSSLEGISANIREKLKYMKDLGLVRRDDYATERMAEYVGILNAGNTDAKQRFLQDCVGRWKLLCPQGSRARWTPNQNGYLHYRIRPGTMLLYAAQCAEDEGVEIDTDDVMLSVLRFFTEKEKAIVDESFLRTHIERYFARKARRAPNYRREFEKQMDRVERDLGMKLRAGDHNAFARKCRNAANDAYCFIIFLRNAGVVETENRNSSINHWSATQQAYEHTPRVPEFNVLTFTDAGRRVLREGLERIPIWFEDIRQVCPAQESRTAFLVNELALGVDLDRAHVTAEDIRHLARLGLKGSFRGNAFVPTKRPAFELQYDMP